MEAEGTTKLSIITALAGNARLIIRGISDIEEIEAASQVAFGSPEPEIIQYSLKRMRLSPSVSTTSSHVTATPNADSFFTLKR